MAQGNEKNGEYTRHGIERVNKSSLRCITSPVKINREFLISVTFSSASHKLDEV